MAKYTPNLNLYEKDPVADASDTFNIKTMMNDNWDKIDSYLGNLSQEVVNNYLESRKVIPNSSKNYPSNPRKAEGLGVISLTPHPLVNNPVLKASDVTDAMADFVADPFIVYENSLYYMFFEVFVNPLGKIAYATSVDGLTWNYQGIILNDSSVHFASPHVFKIDSEWYMLPDMGGSSGGLYLYKATNFPYEWNRESILFTDGIHIDPVLIQKDGMWYLISYDSSTTSCNLYYSSDYKSNNWTLHPSSPIWNGLNIRVGGRPVIYDEIIDIFVQDGSSGIYGEKTYVYRILELSPLDFSYTKIEKPIIKAEYNNKWNSKGMHHIDICLGQGNSLPIAGVDGANEEHLWSIGIYTIGQPVREEKFLKIYNSTNQVIPAIGEWRKLTFDTLEHNSLIGYDTSTSIFTVQEEGYYSIETGVTWILPFTTGIPFQSNILIKKNSNVELNSCPRIVITPTVQDSTFRERMSVNSMSYLQKGDYVEFFVYHNSTMPQTIQMGNINSYCNIRKL